MLSTAMLAGLLLGQGPIAADYFPLKLGTKWTYSDSTGGDMTEEVVKLIVVAGEPAAKVAIKVGGHQVDTVCFRVEGDTVYMVAYDPRSPLDPPRPILKVGPRSAKWTYHGGESAGVDPVPIDMTGEASPKGMATVLDQKAETIEVRLSAKMTSSGQELLNSQQICTYAKGFGLVSMVETSKVAGKSNKRTMKLVKYEPG